MAKLTKERIVSVATATLSSTGHESIALRAVARDLGVTAPALYDHFDSRDALLRALAEHGFHALSEALDVAGDRAIDRIRDRSLAYVQFAADNPELFRLMFMFRPAAVQAGPDWPDTEAADDSELAAATDAFDQGAADLAVAIADGDMVDRDVVDLGLILWAAIHGVATVAITAPSVAAQLADDVINTVLAGLRPEEDSAIGGR